MDVEALRQDKKCLEKSMDAIDARNEELHAQSQKLQVCQLSACITLHTVLNLVTTI